jgi:hypothetical protein
VNVPEHGQDTGSAAPDVDPYEEPASPSLRIPPSVVGAFLLGVVLWLGGACLVLGSGDGEVSRSAGGDPVVVSTVANSAAPSATTAVATPLPDRTSCDEIRGTEYRSTAERDFFQINCRPTVTPTPSASATPPATPSP